ncbi:MAG TPA: rubredoxin [Nitrospirota bacterium]|nr:rubredoxin [Nitrospirota bacterium]
MIIPVEKIPGGISVDGLSLKNGKCGCTTVLPCCYSWSKVRQKGNSFVFTAKLSGPDSQDIFSWSYTVKKEDFTVEVSVEDARDKKIFSGYYPPGIEEWIEKGWAVIQQEGRREDFDLWRCSACRWLYKQHEQDAVFEDLADDWNCPVCKAGKNVFEQVG